MTSLFVGTEQHGNNGMWKIRCCTLNSIIMGRKVAEQIVEMLVENGVNRICAITGDFLNELNDAVRRNKNIKWTHVQT